jgi:hypothetical protein
MLCGLGRSFDGSLLPGEIGHALHKYAFGQPDFPCRRQLAVDNPGFLGGGGARARVARGIAIRALSLVEGPALGRLRGPGMGVVV